MKIKKQLVIEAYERLSSVSLNKFWGFLSICNSINKNQIIKQGVTYRVNTKKVSEKLQDLFNFGSNKDFKDSSIYIRFSKFWVDKVGEQLLNSKPNILDVAIFFLRNQTFQDDITERKLVSIFLNEIKISEQDSRNIFNIQISDNYIPLENYTNAQFFSELKTKMNINSIRTTLTFESPFTIQSHPGELSRAPFIQTLYSGTKIQELLLYTNFDIDEYYLTSKQVPDYNSKIGTNTIFYGAPGTGKSYEVDKLVENIPENQKERITFHPEFDYNSFIGGYKPITIDDNIKYRFVPQSFTNIYVKAWKSDLTIPFYLIIEEINRGNCAEIFGDLFQLLDRNSNYRISPSEELRLHLIEKLGLDNGGIKDGKMILPPNLNLIATMNTSDQSLFPMDSAFKRRWDWKYIPINYDRDILINKSANYIVKINEVNTFKWLDFIEKVNKEYIKSNPNLGQDKCIGNYFIKPVFHTITIEEFINKALFYLWIDVFIDEEDSIFQNNLTYEDFYPIEPTGIQMVKDLINNLGIEIQENE